MNSLRSTRRGRTLVGPAACVAALVFSAAATAAALPQASDTPRPCGGVAKGAPWSYKGQKGTAYTVVGVNGAPCATGIKFMPKWTHDRSSFDLKPVPAGWHCSAVTATALAAVGQCTTKAGGIFEWLPQLKK
jgi:hypothetical protein